VLPPELGDGLVVRTQTTEQPHHFHVAPALGLQTTRRPELLQIPVEVQLQKIARSVPRTASIGCRGADKSQTAKVQPLYKRLNHPANMIGWNQILKRNRKQRLLVACFAKNVSHDGIFPPLSIKVGEFRNRLRWGRGYDE